LGLKGLEIEKNAEEIISSLGRLKVDFGKFSRDFGLIRTHLRNATTCYDSADRKLQRFRDKLKQVESEPSETYIEKTHLTENIQQTNDSPE
jgi:DNA recombination protein RmuC